MSSLEVDATYRSDGTDRSLKLAITEASAVCDVTAKPKNTVAGRLSEYGPYFFQVLPSALTKIWFVLDNVLVN